MPFVYWAIRRYFTRTFTFTRYWSRQWVQTTFKPNIGCFCGWGNIRNWLAWLDNDNITLVLYYHWIGELIGEKCLYWMLVQWTFTRCVERNKVKRNVSIFFMIKQHGAERRREIDNELFTLTRSLRSVLSRNPKRLVEPHHCHPSSLSHWRSLGRPPSSCP